MQTLKNSYKLTRAVGAVFKDNPKLYGLALLCLLINLIIFTVITSKYFFISRFNNGDYSVGVTVDLNLLWIFFIWKILATFFSATLNYELLQAFNGNSVSLRRGMVVAAHKWQAILFFGILSALILELFHLISLLTGKIGRFVFSGIFFTWVAGSYFAPFVLLKENGVTNPFSLLRRSSLLFTNGWHETTLGLGTFYVCGITLIGITGWFGMAMAIFCGAKWKSFTFGLTVGVITISIIFILLTILWLVKKAYLAASYIFISEGAVPVGMSEDLLDSFWMINIPTNKEK